MNNFKRVLTVALSFLAISTVQAASKELDRVAVIVNDGVILQSDIDNALNTVKHNAQQRNQSLPDNSILEDQVIEKLIMDNLQQQEAKRIGVRIDDQRLDSAIAEIAEKNNQTVRQLQQGVIAKGISYAEYREQIRDEIASTEARNALVRRRISILPAEVENLSKLLAQETNKGVQYHLGHIQLRPSNDVTDEALEQQANSIVEKLQQGEEFSKLALTYSKGNRALDGGDWGWKRKEEMPTIFADHIIAQGKGAIIGPFRSGAGFHILKIFDTKGLESVTVTEINARHILINTSIILSDEGARRQLETIRQQILSGKASFAQMAQLNSADPGSASRDGELGFQTPDLYVPEFKYQVEMLPIGEISKPFKTTHGWHIVEVLGRREVDRTESALNNRAYNILMNRKFNEEVSAWLQELRASAYIEMTALNQEQTNGR